MLAILAVAFLALASFALAAEGQGNNDGDGNKQPTMAELGNKVDSIVRQLSTLTATVGSLQTELGTSTGSVASKVDALSTTVAANRVTIVGKFAQQMAVVMTVPNATSGHNATYYLVGDSSITGFPQGTVVALNRRFTDRALPTGTYLFEVQQPYSDNVLCNGKVSISLWGHAPARHYGVCPRVVVTIDRGTGVGIAAGTAAGDKLYDGFGIYDITEKSSGNFRVSHKFPSGFAFTDAKPLGSYSAAVRITKIK